MIGWWVAMGKAARAWTASVLRGSRTAHRLAAVLIIVVVLGCSAAVASAATIVDVGALNTSSGPPYNDPAAANALQEVVLANGSLWANGTVSTAQAPASGPDPTATFEVDSTYSGPLGLGPGNPIINDAGVIVGSASGQTGAPIVTYWNSEHSSTFAEVSLSGLTVNGQPVVAGWLFGVDAAGNAVGYVEDAAARAGTGGAADTAGLFVPASGGVPAGQPQVISSIGGIAITALVGIGASYEDATPATCCGAVLVDRQAQTATQTNISGGEGITPGFADNGTLSGYAQVSNTQSLPTVRLANGSETNITQPSGCNNLVEAVNDSSVSVGNSQCSTGGATGTEWDASGDPTALLSEVSNGTGWSDLTPTAINDQGDVVGQGMLNGAYHGFLITTSGPPTPPVVNSTGDGAAINPSVRGCNTGNTVAGSGGQQVPECTLRAAIQTENAGNASTKTITFDIPGTAPGAIKLGSLLPLSTAAGNGDRWGKPAVRQGADSRAGGVVCSAVGRRGLSGCAGF